MSPRILMSECMRELRGLTSERMRQLRNLTSERMRELRGLIDDVVDADWRHPSWWLFCAALAALESQPGDPAHDHLDPQAIPHIHSDGGPRADTFIGRLREPPRSPGEHVADAVLAARAAVHALATLDGQFPGQPLRVYLARQRGALEPVRLGDHGDQVAFVTPRGTALARISANRADDARLAVELAAFLSGKPGPHAMLRELPDHEATRALVAVVIGNEARATLRHVHRRAWTRGGGPWLGIGTCSDMQVVTTCHLIVDGYGHARTSAEIFDHHDRLAATRRRELIAHAEPLLPRHMPALPAMTGLPLGLAMAELDVPSPDFAAMAHALGAVLEEHVRGHLSPARRRAFGHTPAFQVPVAPGNRHDPARWRRRIIPALISVRMKHGVIEPLDSFRRRVPALLDRERQSRGLLARMRGAMLSMPLPLAMKRRLVASAAVPLPWLPPVELLAGRSCLSLLRFPEPETPRMPLFAASAPPLDAWPRDPAGSSVLTVIPHVRGLAVTLCGTGASGTDKGAEELLARWLELVCTPGSRHMPRERSLAPADLDMAHAALSVK